jgi:mono/diheme cytochrome c family protein
MKKTLFVVILLALVVLACQQTTSSTKAFLNTSRLTATLFSIDITKDTFLVTPRGAVIQLPMGTLATTGGNIVQLEVKEAYNMQDILNAGLTTQSNGQPLSSGGMIYINAVGENTVRITKAIKIATPTPFIEPNMQLFKGVIKEDSTINWTDPQPLPANPLQTGLERGKQLFEMNCSSCHRIDKHMTAPALAHVIKKMEPYVGEGGITHAYDFTRNNAEVLTHDCYYQELFRQWSKTVMPVYPTLTREELDNLYGYIENESDRLRLPVPDNGIMRRLDSCRAYHKVAGKLIALKQQLEQDSTILVDELRDTVSNISFDTTLPPVPATVPENLVDIKPGKSLYYQFTIEAFGWYNVDILLKNLPGLQESTLTVSMQGMYRKNFQLYLAIPDMKVLTQAGTLKDAADSYGFATDDGKINLPQNTKAWVFAVGEENEQILFAHTSFTTSTQQQLTLNLSAVSQEIFQREIKKMGIPDIQLQVAATQTGIELHKVIKELKSAEQLKPVNMNCDCLPFIRSKVPLSSIPITVKK